MIQFIKILLLFIVSLCILITVVVTLEHILIIEFNTFEFAEWVTKSVLCIGIYITARYTIHHIYEKIYGKKFHDDV
jgi:hypothetical protein